MKRKIKFRGICITMVFTLFIGSSPIFYEIRANENLPSNNNLSNINIINDNIDNMYSLEFNNHMWNYDDVNDVYWQLGVVYTGAPHDTTYQSLGIYVPGNYMDSVKNIYGKYSCTINVKGEVNGYNAETAPIVLPINTPGYSAMAAPNEYNFEQISSYMDAGFIYVHAGCRGRLNSYNDNSYNYYDIQEQASGSAPWGVTDLKAAIRYLRYNEEALPGNMDKIFTFGMSGGGAQSAIVGASGDCQLYFDYLVDIGAAMTNAKGETISDAVYGTMAWCPITSFDYADAAYEWMMGQYFSTGTRANTTWTSELSKDLSQEFANYINMLGLLDSNGTELKLTQTNDGLYTAGSYYDYLLEVINQSLNNFLDDTKFPYTSGSESSRPNATPNRNVERNNAHFNQEVVEVLNEYNEIENGSNPTINNNTQTTFQTAQEYIDSLNSEYIWINYDPETNTAQVSSVEDFVVHLKNARKDVGAFDDLNRNQAENYVFGVNNNPSHFNITIANLLEVNKQKYASFDDFEEDYIKNFKYDLKVLDDLGNSVQKRMDMYNPMYYLHNFYDGYGLSTPAKHWRIRSGINQTDTSVTVEMNLALALLQNENVEDVDFQTVWNMGHVTAERIGDSTTNFIAWVEDLTK